MKTKSLSGRTLVPTGTAATGRHGAGLNNRMIQILSTALVCVLVLSGCSSSTDSTKSDESSQQPGSTPDQQEYAGWVNDTEFMTLNPEEQASRITVQTYAAGSYASFNSVAVGSDGSIYSAGGTSTGSDSTGIIVKYDANLVEQHVVKRDMSDYNSFIDLVIDAEGSVFALVGGYDSYGDLCGTKIVKYDAGLNELGEVYQEDSIYGLSPTFDGSLLAAGSRSRGTSTDAILQKYDANLIPTQSVTWNAGGNEAFVSLATASDGSIFVVGMNMDPVSVKISYTILKYDADMNKLADEYQCFEDTRSIGSLAIAEDGTLYAISQRFDSIEITRFDNRLETIATASFLINSADSMTLDVKDQHYYVSLAIGTDGSVYAAGFLLTDAANPIMDMLVTKLDSELNEVNTVIWDSTMMDRFNDICIALDGTVYTAGNYESVDLDQETVIVATIIR